MLAARSYLSRTVLPTATRRSDGAVANGRAIPEHPVFAHHEHSRLFLARLRGQAG
jgi:hypothetical protein